MVSKDISRDEKLWPPYEKQHILVKCTDLSV